MEREMKHLSIPVIAIASVIPFIDAKHQCAYLRGALLESRTNGAALVATDGHALAVYRIGVKQGHADPVTLPHDLLVSASKLKFGEAKISIPDDGPLQMETANGVQYFAPIRDKCIEWRKAIPSDVSGEPSAFGRAVIAPLLPALKLHRSSGVRIYPAGERTAVFEMLGAPMSGVLMAQKWKDACPPNVDSVLQGLRA